MPGQVLDIDQLLTIMTKQGASDLHLKPARPPLLRINGKLLPLKTDPLTIDDMQRVVDKVLQKESQRKKLEDHLACDVGYGVPGVARFRGNIYSQRGHLAAVFRRVPFETMSLEDLDLPSVIKEFCKINMGLVLVTGPTGSGKSTTLAAIIKWITANRPIHIITIEDPVEFLFRDGMASISQREVGTDTFVFGEALRNAMRQDPDVIMVGEMRDAETIHTVITAAETGHLVFSTLHTNSSTQTIDRVLDSFSADQQSQIRAQLAQVLSAVISIKLLRKPDGKGRIAALEIMRTSPKIAKMIEKGNTTELHEELEASVGYYRMQSMNQSILSLLVRNAITYQEAMDKSPDPEDLSLKLRRMFPKIEEQHRQGGTEVPAADFAEIQELLQFRKLYEEQEVKTQERMAEKDEHAQYLEQRIAERDRQVQQLEARIEEMRQEGEKMRGDFGRLQEETQQKMMQARERIKELNQKLSGGGAAPSGDRKSGIFR